jgi:hypothetical protein
MKEEAVGMELTNQQIAEAFSHHDFEAAYPYLTEDVRWNIVGQRRVEGKEKGSTPPSVDSGLAVLRSGESAT